MLRYTLLQPISHETELLLLFLLEVSAFLLPSPFFWLLLSLFWPPSLPFSPPSYFCQEGSLFTDIHHHISYDMYLSSHTRGIPKKSGPSDQFRTYSGPLLALRSGSGPSPEFRTLLVPLIKRFRFNFLWLSHKYTLYSLQIFPNVPYQQWWFTFRRIGNFGG